MLPWCSCFLKHDSWFVVVQLLSSIRLFATPWTRACQASLSFPISQSSNSFTLSQWCHPTILFSVVSFSSCLQSFPASQSLPMSRLFASGGQSIGVSASASVQNPKGLLKTPGSISVCHRHFKHHWICWVTWPSSLHSRPDLLQSFLWFWLKTISHSGHLVNELQ